MGEEEKKPVEEKKPEEPKKDVEPEKKKDEAAPAVDEKEAAAPPPPAEESKPVPPPPPQEIILKVFMHCEGCARKVRRCLKGFDGVEEVVTDCRTSKVVVKGEKADPVAVLERVQRKSHRQVTLISPIPAPAPPPAEEPKKAVDEAAKPEEKKEEPPVVIVVLRVHMHCEACAQEIKRRIQKMKGVESAEADLKSSEVTVKGVMEPPQLVDFIHKRTGKHAEILKVEEQKKTEDEKEKPKEAAKEEKKESADAEKEAKKEPDAGNGKEGGGEAAAAPEAKPDAPAEGDNDQKLEIMKKNELHYLYNYPHNHHQQLGNYHGHVQESYGYAAYPPQMFSDENPNACSVM